MADSASCGGSCAQRATTCGVVAGTSFGAIGSPIIGAFGGPGFLPHSGGHHSSQGVDVNSTSVDGDAHVDLNRPGHREALKTISHDDDDKYEKITQWLTDELQRIERRSDPQK